MLHENVTTAAATARQAAVRAQESLDRLASVGLRRTAARAEVLRLLASCDRHLSGSQVFERLRAAGSQQDRATVWRTLTVLADVGVLHSMHHDGAATYGLADIPHHHAACRSCGTVTELSNAQIAPVVTAAEAATGFRLEPSGLHLIGTCPDCLAAG